MNKVVAKVKPVAFTGVGAAVGAAAGGPAGLGIGAGVGALIDWWRHKKAAVTGSLAEPPVMVAPSVVHLLPIQMQQNPYHPATLDAISRLKAGSTVHYRPGIPPKKPAPKKPTPPKPPIVATVVPAPSKPTSDGSASIDWSAQGSFTL